MAEEQKDIIIGDNEENSEDKEIEWPVQELIREQAFALWASGSTLSEVGKEVGYAPITIFTWKKEGQWEERKEYILKKVQERISDSIELSTAKRKKTMAQMINATADEITRTYNEYLQNPIATNKPFWMPSNVKELDLLFRLFEYVKSDGVEKSAVAIADITDSVNDLPEKVAEEMLTILAKVKTDKLIKQSKKIKIFKEDTSKDETSKDETSKDETEIKELCPQKTDKS